MRGLAFILSYLIPVIMVRIQIKDHKYIALVLVMIDFHFSVDKILCKHVSVSDRPFTHSNANWKERCFLRGPWGSHKKHIRSEVKPDVMWKIQLAYEVAWFLCMILGTPGNQGNVYLNRDSINDEIKIVIE